MPNNLIFILGAGASREAGVPTMYQFLDQTEIVIQKLNHHSRLDEELKSSYLSIMEMKGMLNNIYHKANIDLDNIEHLYGALTMGKIFGGIGEKGINEIDILLDQLELVIIRTIEESMVLGNDIFHAKSPEPYDNFLRVLKQIYNKTPTTNITILTFNYDLGFEIAHSVEGPRLAPYRDFCYCLNGEKLDFNTIKYLKLHGSLNWGLNKNKTISTFNVRDFRKQPSILTKQNDLKENTYPIGSELKNLLKNEFVNKIAIIPPSFNKDYKYNQLQNVWKEAARQLSLADRIYISGFSLNSADNFFRYLFSIGTISNNNLKSIKVYNYDPNTINSKETEQRFSKLIADGIKKRYNYYNKKFSEMIIELDEEKGTPYIYSL